MEPCVSRGELIGGGSGGGEAIWYLEDGEGDELVELLRELVPELALVEIRHSGVPLRELRLGCPLRLQVLQRRHGECVGGRGLRSHAPLVIRGWSMIVGWVSVSLCYASVDV
jgi:hypothetical protein